MTFPIPSHLSQKSTPQDISTKILSEIDAATNKTLNSALATSWLVELDQTIQLTKGKIHELVQRDFPTFERQLTFAKSVQTRLHTLTTHVDALNDSVSNPGTGLIPTLVKNLSSHTQTAQETLDASVTFDALSHLLRCNKVFRSISSLIEAGMLPDAAGVCVELDSLLQETPAYLNETNVIIDLRVKFQEARARNEEQLSDAYTRGVVISHDEFTISPSVQVRLSETVLSLQSILSSLSQNSLTNHLTTLRRNLTAYFIDLLLRQPSSVSTVGLPEHKFSRFPLSPDDGNLASRLENLSTFFTFISSHLFPSLPPSERILFPRSLCKPTTGSLLNSYLIPALPSSFDRLPPFMELVQRSVVFEENFLIRMFGNDPNDRPVKAWAEGLSGHYERQRRLLVLDCARSIVLSVESLNDSFFVEISVTPDVISQVSTDQTFKPRDTLDGVRGGMDGVEDDAWGFEDDVDSGAGSSFDAEEDNWGFSDDVILEPGPEPELEQIPPLIPGKPSSSPRITSGDKEPDPSDAWGWSDEENALTEETAWDNPWNDESLNLESRPTPGPSISLPATTTVQRTAIRLEKAANRDKTLINGQPSPSFTSPGMSSLLPHSLSSPRSNALAPGHLQSMPESGTLAGNTLKESYSVSGRLKGMVGLVENILNEGKQLASSKLFPPSESNSVAAGTIIILSAPSVLDLYRALYPVAFAKELGLPEGGMRFSNDCAYLGSEVERIRKGLSGDIATVTRVRFEECEQHFKVLSKSWFHDVIRQQQQSIDEIIGVGAQGFIDSGNQDRYDECEAAITHALQVVRGLSEGLKGMLTKSGYYTALGMVANAALSRILQDVLALPDIPEVESHHLSELCRILHAMEGLFVEDPTQPSFIVSYVPLWLKFSYLSELLEASMADITYLFEAGALVDFQIDELVRIIRALFADTPLRTNTINKVLGGHPVLSQ